MAGKPGAAPDDDDLIVELEDGPTDFAPSEPEGVEELRTEQAVAPTLPSEIENEDEGEEPSRAPAARHEESAAEDETVLALDAARVREEMEGQLRQERANSIWTSAQAQARVVESERNSAQVGLNTLKDRLDMAYSALNQATEAGDSAARMQIERDIRNMEDLRTQIQSGLERLPTRDAVLADGEAKARAALAVTNAGQKVGAGINARNALAARWASSNGWMKTNARANAEVLRISESMAKSGIWDPESPGFYTELGRRLSLSYPNLKIQDLQAQKRGAGKAQMRTPVAPTRSSSGGAIRQSGGKTTYKITQSEQATMKRHRLDPGNPSHQKAWAKVRMQRSQREAREGAR